MREQGRSFYRDVFRRLWKNPIAVFGLIIIFLLVLLAIFAPQIAPYDPYAINLRRAHESPSWDHPFGTDFFGRDVMSRMIYGARVSLIMGIGVISVRAFIGITLGLLAGYYRGWVETLIMRLTDAVIAFPGLILALAIMAVRGPGLFNVFLALSIVGWTTFARLVRGEVLSAREQDYIVAIKALGAKDLRIITRHVLPNILPAIIVYSTLGIAAPIIAEAGLSFLGLGAGADEITWGFMISMARGYIRYAWWSITFPGLAIVVVVLAFNLLGDGLRDILDPRMKDT